MVKIRIRKLGGSVGTRLVPGASTRPQLQGFRLTAAPNAGGEPVQRVAPQPRGEQGQAHSEEEDVVSLGSDDEFLGSDGQGGEPDVDVNDLPVTGENAGDEADEDTPGFVTEDGATSNDGRTRKAASKRSKTTKGSKAAKTIAAAKAARAALVTKAAQLLALSTPAAALTAGKRSRTKTGSLTVKQKKLHKTRSPYNLRPRQLAADLNTAALGALLDTVPTPRRHAHTNAGAAALSAAAAPGSTRSPYAEPTPARGADPYRQAVVNGTGTNQRQVTSTAAQNTMLQQLLDIMTDNNSKRGRIHDLEEERDVLKARCDSYEDVISKVLGGLGDGERDQDLRGSDPAGSGSEQDLSECDSDRDGSVPELESEYDLRQLLNSLRAKTAAKTTAAMADSAKHLRTIAAKPQQFDGKAGRQGVRDWLAGLKEYIMLVADSCTPEYQVRLAATFLKDGALRVWQTERAVLPADQRSSWDVFEQVMLDRYDTGTDAVTARYQLDALLQGDDQSVVSFVQRFDTLISYVPDMSEKEKVHRFLASVRPDVHDKLHLNPLTNERWIRYVELRRFALKQYAHETAMRVATGASAVAGRRRRIPGHGRFQRAGIVQAAAGDKRGATGGWQPAGKKGKGSRFAQQPFGQQGQRGSGQQQQTRSRLVKQFCFDRQLCYRCYGKGHAAKDCTNDWVDAEPTGYNAGNAARAAGRAAR